MTAALQIPTRKPDCGAFSTYDAESVGFCRSVSFEGLDASYKLVSIYAKINTVPDTVCTEITYHPSSALVLHSRD